MKVTKITKDTLEYFASAIGKLFRENDRERICLGLLDDDDNAVGACVLDIEMQEAVIRYFGIVDECRRKGYGKFFMDEVIKSLNPAYVKGVEFGMFVEEDEGNEFFDFLSNCDFQIEKGSTKRSLYDLEEVVGAYPFGKGKLSKNKKLVRGMMVNEEQEKQIRNIEDKMTEEGMYFDSDFILSKDNKYGGIMFEGKEIKGIIGIGPFEDGIRLEGIYASQNSLEELLYLFDYSIEAIKQENIELKTLYIDSGTEKLLKFEDAIMKKKGISYKERLSDLIAWRAV